MGMIQVNLPMKAFNLIAHDRPGRLNLLNRLQNTLGENVRAALILQGHVGSIFNRLNGGRIAWNAHQRDRFATFHAGRNSNRFCGLSCCYSRGRWLWLRFGTTKKWNNDEGERGFFP